MRTRDGYPLLRIKYSPQCDWIGKVFDAEVSSPRELGIGINLLLGREIWLRDNGLRIDNKLCRIRKIFRIVTDMYFETFASEGIEKRRI
jgi:hypothetical protein